MNVLITSAWLRSSYSMMRQLSKSGHNVYCCDTKKIGMCQWSRFSSGFDLYSCFYSNEKKFIRDLVFIVQKRKIDLIIPSHDETAVLAKYRNFFSEQQLALLPTNDQCDLFNNKKSSYDFARNLGVNIPKRFSYDDPNTIAKLLSEDNNSTKYVIKLLKGNSSKGVFYAKNAQEVQTTVNSLIKKFDLTKDRWPQVEEYVEGIGCGVSVLYWRGKVKLFFTHRRLSEKIKTGGTSTVRQSCRIPIIEKAALRIFDKVQYHGLAMMEFKYEPMTGKYWFIEVNPRLWGSIPLAISSNADFATAALKCIEGRCDELGSSAELQMQIKIGWTNKWLLGDIFRLSSVLFTSPKEIADLWSTKVDGYDDIFFDDPFVFWGQLIRYAQNVVQTKSINPSIDGMLG